MEVPIRPVEADVHSVETQARSEEVGVRPLVVPAPAMGADVHSSGALADLKHA